ncbi:hypothetical protein DFO66_11245 [Brevibacterium sanguinis]|uniref:Uncharacterized protein n=2 Tax=Brevibacterium TaxID=1696 RepID=A0A366IEV9_9MICO|nr:MULTISPECIES: hypothetical protein [Brevibacterium]RBP62941.1 hypothetical protein DFO66_11245 [Brevibacterium sanguinis]RBP69514.1 hypothetical protein DFO65_11248 [Brevibacterium celere]
MNSIRFSGFQVVDAQRLSFEYSKNEGSESGELFFESSEPLPFDPNSVARVLYTLIGKAYDDISIDLNVSRDTAEMFRRYVSPATSFLSESGSERNVPRSGNLLNFSGGFDSLAALQLMPSGTKLVSMDFGGPFQREERFFSNFETTTIKTNIVGTEFQMNSWAMMGIAAILASPVYRSKYMTFGGIAGNTPDTIRMHSVASYAPTFPPFAYSGYRNAAYVVGISEAGTAMLIAHHMPELLCDSLVSLAADGSAKKYRKTWLATIAAERLGLDFNIDPAVPPSSPAKWGHHFTTDFASLYILKHAGREVFDTMLRDVPDEVYRVVDLLSLDFFERLNTTNMLKFPAELWGGLMDRATAAGIVPYTERDWSELGEVRQLFSRTFPQVLS